MGETLSTPNLEKNIDNGYNNDLEYGICSIQGYRPSMEDTFFAAINIGEDKNLSLFGVCDGHGGKEISSYIAQNFQSFLEKNENFKNRKYQEALKETFLSLDKSLLEKEVFEKLLNYSIEDRKNEEEKFDKIAKEVIKEDDKITEDDITQMKAFKNLFDPRNLEDCNVAYFCGSTACVVLFGENDIFIANAGDSRCILLDKDGIVRHKTTDHKCTNQEEKKRIEQAEGFIEGNRIKGCLDVTRGFGDLEYKTNEWLRPEDQMITANPEIISVPTKDVDYVVLGCDGFFEPINEDSNNGKIGKFIFDKLKEKKRNDGNNISDVISLFIDELVKKDEKKNPISSDNITGIVIKMYEESKVKKEVKKKIEKKNVKEEKKEKKKEEKKDEGEITTESKANEKSEEKKKEEEKKEEEKKEEGKEKEGEKKEEEKEKEGESKKSDKTEEKKEEVTVVEKIEEVKEEEKKEKENIEEKKEEVKEEEKKVEVKEEEKKEEVKEEEKKEEVIIEEKVEEKKVEEKVEEKKVEEQKEEVKEEEKKEEVIVEEKVEEKKVEEKKEKEEDSKVEDKKEEEVTKKEEESQKEINLEEQKVEEKKEDDNKNVEAKTEDLKKEESQKEEVKTEEKKEQ